MKPTLILALCVTLTVVAATATHPGYTATPHGMRKSDCVLQIPSGSAVEEGPNGQIIVTPPSSSSQEAFLFSAPSHCGEDLERAMASRTSARNPHPKQEEGDVKNGWQDYLYWFGPNGGHFGYFAGTYTVPAIPATVKDQTDFYFLGLENLDDNAPVNILQPVLTFGNGEVEGHWHGASWACCPHNITVHSETLSGFAPGDVLNGTMVRDSPSQWTISLAWNGQETTLRPVVGSYDYTWADVTLEAYNIADCSEFPKGPMTFDHMSLKTDDGTEMINKADWTKVQAPSCGGKVSLLSPEKATITLTANDLQD